MATNQTNQLLPVYLVTGADELKRETTVRRLHKRIAQLGDLAFNYDHFTSDNVSGEAVLASCNTLPFASDVRLVQVDNADRLKKADSEAIISYLAAPSDSTVLCLVAESLAKNTRLYKAVAKVSPKAVIDCAPVKRKDLPALVRNMALTHGIAITDSGANALIDLVGEDTISLDTELQKIALAHRGSDPVNDNEVNALVSRTAEAKPWEFVDAFSSRNIRKCMMLQAKMPSVKPMSLLAMCVNRIRELIAAKAFVERGNPSALAKFLGLPDWRVKNHSLWARSFTKDELICALVQARDAEKAIKTGADADVVFQEWYVSVVTGHKRCCGERVKG